MQDDSFKEYVLDQLASLGNVSARRMFGAHGLYKGGAFFGIIWKGALFLKTNETSRKAFTERGMKPFRPSAKQTLKNYYEVPAEILDDNDSLCAWARTALSCAPKK